MTGHDPAAHRVTRSPKSPAHRGPWAACLLLLQAALVAALLPGCSEPAPQARCDWMKKSVHPAEGQPQGQTLILVDMSSSARGSTPASGGFDHARFVEKRAGTWLADVATVSVAAFGGDSNDIRWIARDWAVRPEDGGNETNKTRRRDAVPHCVSLAVTDAQATVPDRGGSDVLGAMTEAGGALADVEGTRRLIVLTDGLPTTGCADLRDAGFEGDLEIDAIVRRCQAAEDVTRGSLASVRTVLAGVGRTAREEPQASNAQTHWLGRLWARLCAAAHQDTARSEDCTVAPVTGSEPLSQKASVRRPRDPEIAFPHRTYKEVGARALFNTDSSALLREAQPELKRIAVELRHMSGIKVRVLGYVDPRGGSANNRRLSQARADAVRAELERLGVKGVTAVGKGVADGCPGAGALGKEQKLQCDRRVDIVVVR
ncbi:OmpA family protein [Streptomyces sp. NPDC096080]|uniref:OmpA family protein n=1 Tax=Streptomyces sp. NPDC096080 TaxID=3156693 RepID=UPI00333355A1